MDFSFGHVEWIDHLRFDEKCKSSLIANVGKFQNCTLEPDGQKHAVLDLYGKGKGWIQYDVDGGHKLCQKRCVVIGRQYRWESGGDYHVYHVIVVMSTGVDSEYRRLGVGSIPTNCVVGLRTNVRVI